MIQGQADAFEKNFRVFVDIGVNNSDSSVEAQIYWPDETKTRKEEARARLAAWEVTNMAFPELKAGHFVRLF